MQPREQELSWLTDIKWLSPDDARRIYALVDQWQSREHYGLDSRQVRAVERVTSEADMTEWLRQRVPAATSRVYMVFGRAEVCWLPTATFFEHWQDILCPSRDDAIITGESADWVLFYCHDDEFEFGYPIA